MKTNKLQEKIRKMNILGINGDKSGDGTQRDEGKIILGVVWDSP
jgi:hypothetical protein